MTDLFAIFVTMLSLTLAGFIGLLLFSFFVEEQRAFKEEEDAEKY